LAFAIYQAEARYTPAEVVSWQNHCAAISLWFAFYSFCRIPQVAPVYARHGGKIMDHIWTVRELLEAI